MEDLLLLFLGMKISLLNTPRDFLTIRELSNVSLVSAAVRQKLRRVEYTRCRDGRDYLVPFPGFPGVLSTAKDLFVGAGLFQHQLASLEAMFQAENRSEAFGSLRGGILGDAPGLGKTITLLALVASTAGVRPMDAPEFWDKDGMDEGWKQLRKNASFQRNLLGALKPVRSWVHEHFTKMSSQRKVYQGLERFVSPPYPDDRLSTIRDFELYVIRQLRPFVPRSALELFRKNALELKAGLDKRNRKVLCSDEGKRLTWERSLVPCSATLIIVPDALLEHWCQQIHNHLHLTPFADENENLSGGIRGVVHLDGIGDSADARIPLGAVSMEAQVQPVWELSKYLMVVTTFSRCESEFRKEVAAGRIQGIPSRQGRGRNNKRTWDAVNCQNGNHSPLLQMRWLRLVVDEGHELGTYEAGNSVTRFINEVAAERRWVLSGTPTTGDEDDVAFSARGLDQLQRLLFFLRHPVYGKIPASPAQSKSPYVSNGTFGNDNGKKTKAEAKQKWVTAVKEPFLAKKEIGKQELLRILRQVMVMHRKEDIHLPKPVFRQAEVDVPIPDHIQATLTQQTFHCQQDLGNYLETEEFQSLVDQAQARYIVQAIRNAQRALMDRGGPDTAEAFAVVAEYHNIGVKEDNRPIKAVVYSSIKNNLLSVAEHLYRQLVPENVAEMYGGIGDMSAELSRFRNGCKECKRCPVCRAYNDVTGSGRCQNILLEVVTQSAPHIRFLIEPERICRALTPGDRRGNVHPDRLEGDPMTSYSSHRKSWRIGDVLEVDIRDPHPLLAARASEETWAEYGSGTCKRIASRDNYEGSAWFFGPLPYDGRDRAVVTLAKWQKCGRFHNHAIWYNGPRLADAPLETVKENAFVLCLDASLAHGLDLSFVTHIFLLEPIDDAALLEQVTSRAHRLGATGPVHVETVNALYKLSADTEKAIQTSTSCTTNTVLLADKERSLSKVVCQFCYRQFDSEEKVEAHEETNCPRNPDNAKAVDPFHLSSVYREIKQPPPRASSSCQHHDSQVRQADAING